MKQYDENIMDVIFGLKWGLIVNLRIQETGNSTITKEEMIEELKSVIKFMIESKIRVLKTNCWHIRFAPVKEKESGYENKLEVFYIATGLSCQLSADFDKIQFTDLNSLTELKVLEAYYANALAREDYEMCGALRRRLRAFKK